MIKYKSGFIEPRRSHIAHTIGKNFVVYGGLNTQGQYLSDMMALNLSKQ